MLPSVRGFPRLVTARGFRQFQKRDEAASLLAVESIAESGLKTPFADYTWSFSTRTAVTLYSGVPTGSRTFEVTRFRKASAV